MPQAEIYSFATFAEERKKMIWSPDQVLTKAPVRLGDTWVCKTDRDECTIEGLTHDRRGRRVVHYLIKSEDEVGEWLESSFRRTWCEKQEFLRKMNEALGRVIKLRPAVSIPPLEKGWEVWRENDTGELCIVTGVKRIRNQTIHTVFKGTAEGEISAKVLEEMFTWISTV